MSPVNPFSPDTQARLVDAGVDPAALHPIPGSTLHRSVTLPDAWTDGSCLVFVDVRPDAQDKFLYYFGAEREGTLEYRNRNVTVWTGVYEGRLSRFVPGYDRQDDDEDEG